MQAHSCPAALPQIINIAGPQDAAVQLWGTEWKESELVVKGTAGIQALVAAQATSFAQSLSPVPIATSSLSPLALQPGAFSVSGPLTWDSNVHQSHVPCILHPAHTPPPPEDQGWT